MASHKKNKNATSRPSRASGKKQQQPKKTGPTLRETVPKVDVFEGVKRMGPPSHLPGWQAAASDASPSVGTTPSAEKTGNNKPTKGRKQQAGTQKKQQKNARKKQEKQAKRKTAQNNNKPAKPVHPAKRRRRRLVAAVLGLIVLIGVGFWLSTTLLFKIKTYEVEGKTSYSKEEIVTAFGHEVGENLLTFNAGTEQKRMQQSLPYLEEVVIRRRLPNTVVFRVTPAVEAYCMLHQDGFAVLSTSLKVLRLAPEQPEGLVVIKGLQNVTVALGLPLQEEEAEEAKSEVAVSASTKLQLPVKKDDSSAVQSAPASGVQSAPVSSQLAAADEQAQEEGAPAQESAPPASAAASSEAADAALFAGVDDTGAMRTTTLQALQALLGALKQHKLTDVAWVDVTSPVDLRFSWQNRVVVKLGSKSNIGEKMRFAQVLLVDEEKSQIASEAHGTLDVSAYPDNMDRVWFRPE